MQKKEIEEMRHFKLKFFFSNKKKILNQSKIIRKIQRINKNTQNMTDQVWRMDWNEKCQKEKETWNVSIPKFKYCKKRKEFFTEDWTETWYKSPYKYNSK